MSNSLSKLPIGVTDALKRAAKRIDSYTSCDQAGMVDIITEELRPVLLGGSLGAVTAATLDPIGTSNWSVGSLLMTLSEATVLPRRYGCIGTRYCHPCKVSYGGTCLCMPNKCHHCGAECGTTPPPEDTHYKHEMHY